VGFVKKSNCITFEEWTNKELTQQSVLATARQMMGFPYLWGGTSSKGIDCSGFVKVAYYAQGVIVARDASQQARYGEAIDFTNVNNLQPADLLFFGKSAQRISHVGIYQGKGEFIHASGKVYISSVIPGDPKYDPNRNFVAARRILGSVDSEGIERVKNHPWYNIKP
jgi:cell wall-associated NlpC family hydrolase